MWCFLQVSTFRPMGSLHSCAVWSVCIGCLRLRWFGLEPVKCSSSCNWSLRCGFHQRSFWRVPFAEMIWARMKALLMAVLLPQSSPAAFHLCLVMGLGLKSWLLKTPYWFWPPSVTASFCRILCYFALYYYALYRLPCECLTLNSPFLCCIAVLYFYWIVRPCIFFS